MRYFVINEETCEVVFSSDSYKAALEEAKQASKENLDSGYIALEDQAYTGVAICELKDMLAIELGEVAFSTGNKDA
jgi:hypothetical protein